MTLGRGKPDALCLTGPTASGKSAVAMALADVLPIEIISVDSALVYRGMDIGTAKPSRADRAAVPHHLIDIVEPTAAYDAARFAADARRLIAEIRARGRLPLLVGGTMLYFKALREGLDAMPPADPAVRGAIEADATRRGWAALHADLAAADPVTAARVAPADTQRIQRALEVLQISGRPISHWHRHPAPLQAGDPSSHPALVLPMLSLEPASRAWLHAAIGERLNLMMAAGLADEIRALRARGDLHPGLPSVRCVGYRQLWEAVQHTPDTSALDDAVRRAAAATRQLAKRQLTWLRSVPDRVGVVCDQPGARTVARDRLLNWAVHGV